MPMLVRGGRNALALGATIAAVVLFGTVCSVDNAGLSGSGAGGKGGGSGGSAGHGGGTAGAGSGGMIGAGGNVIGTGGRIATGGMIGSGGMVGTGGMVATGGTIGTGGASTGGTTGSGGTAGAAGGTAGAGGVAGAAGSGSGGTGGAAGGGGMNASGGAGGAAGVVGTGGHGGARPTCASFPSGSSLTTPTDGKLHCYWVHGSQIDWNSAETVCENEGGTLVTILSESENNTVVQLATAANLFMGIGMSGQVFIGATDGLSVDDRSGAGDYTWVTGEPWGYQHWHSGQPDGACMGCSGPGPGTGCGCDHRGAIASDGTWYDRTETTTRPFVCEAIAP